MIYTDMTRAAMTVAFNAHKEQFDKTGVPYIFHPVHLAEQMNDEVSICAAFLHDVIEDTDLTYENLTEQGISAEVIEVVKILTHEESVSYEEYILNIKKSSNKTAIKIKLADLMHNSDPARIDLTDQAARVKLEQYKKAISFLTE